MRITAGEFRGRNLPVPDVQGLRPTPSKVRQALFNILPSLLPSQSLQGIRVLDLFSGSGIISAEALSRGAERLVSIEHHKDAVLSIQATFDLLDMSREQWEIIAQPLPAALNMIQHQHFQLIFADPPYRQTFPEKIIDWLQHFQIGFDILVIEEASDVNIDWKKTNLNHLMSRRYGRTQLHFLQPCPEKTA